MAYNKNGLNIRMDVEATEKIQTGMYNSVDNELVYEIDVILSELDGGAKNIVSYSQKLPSNVTVRKAEMIVAEAAAGGTSIDIGLENENGTAAIDSDGFWDGVTTGSMTANAEITGSGALVGTTLSAKGIFSVTTVGTFTAGRVKARLTCEVL